MCQAGSPPPPCLSTARSRRLPRSRPCVLPGTQAAIGARSWALVQRHLEGRRWAPEACSAQRDGRGYRPRCQWRGVDETEPGPAGTGDRWVPQTRPGAENWLSTRLLETAGRGLHVEGNVLSCTGAVEEPARSQGKGPGQEQTDTWTQGAAGWHTCQLQFTVGCGYQGCCPTPGSPCRPVLPEPLWP